MIKLLYRLKQIQPEISKLLKDGSSVGIFSQNLHQQSVEFYHPLLPHWRDIHLEYDLLRVQLAHKFDQLLQTQKNLNLTQPQPDLIFKQALIAALVYAEILERMNLLMNNPQEIWRLQQDQTLYRKCLRVYGIPFYYPARDFFDRQNPSLSDQIRQVTASTNWPRLMLVRIKRVLDTLVPLVKNAESFRRMVYVIDTLLNPIFAYLAWIFYVPRLATNVFNTMKNTITRSSMDQFQQMLNWQRRLLVQWQKLWFELCNDSIWMTVGLINCFVLTGALAPAAIYLTVFLYIFDIILAGIRAFIEINRFKKLSGDYEQMIVSESVFEQSELCEYKSLLDQHIKYEKARLWLSVGTTSALFFGMCFALPVFAINPFIPAFGASFIVLTCLLGFYTAKKIEPMQPKAELPKNRELSRSGFFKAKVSEPILLLQNEGISRLSLFAEQNHRRVHSANISNFRQIANHPG